VKHTLFRAQVETRTEVASYEAEAAGVFSVLYMFGRSEEDCRTRRECLLIRPDDSRSLAKALLALLTSGLHLAGGAWRRAQVCSLERRSRELLQVFLEQTEKAP
jgi:hypothetical protein